MRVNPGKAIFIASILAAAMLLGCGKDIYYQDTTYQINNISLISSGDTLKKNLIFLITSRYGLGDNGVQDLIYEGIIKSLHERKDISLEWQDIGGSKEAASKMIKKWLDEGKNPGLREKINKRLLILTDGKYMSLLKEDPSIKPDPITDILVMETSDTSRSDIYTRYISPYASYFLASRMINDECIYLECNALIKCLAPNMFSEYASDAIQGLKDGFLSDYFMFLAGQPTITYMAGNQSGSQDLFAAASEGFSQDETAFLWCENGYRDTLGTYTKSLFSQDETQILQSKPTTHYKTGYKPGLYTALLPMAGYSSTGVSQFYDKISTTTLFNELWLLAMDKKEPSGIANLTTIRRYDLLTYDFISHWANGDWQSKSKIELYGEYEYLTPGDKASSLNTGTNSYYIDEAMRYEHEYFSKK